jgi:hypothetical protein
MAVLLSCKCGKQISVTEGAAGISIRCEECGGAIKVPSLGEMRQSPNLDVLPELRLTGEELADRRPVFVAAILLIGFGGLVFLLGVGLFLGNVTGFFRTISFAGYAVMTVGVTILGAGCRAFAECRGR